MNLSKIKFVFLTSLTVCAWPALAQSFQPKTIQFKGDPEYTADELTAATGLKKGVALTPAEMGERSRKLMASGAFENITYTFDGLNLIFQLVPASVLLPIRFENLPLTTGKELDDRIHTTLPLYHGKVPTQGDLLDDVRKALEAELATKGIVASISAAPYTDISIGKVTAMSFTIDSPTVRVGEIQMDGASETLAPKARLAVAKFVGSTYSTDGSPSQLETALTNYYGEQGYLDTAIHVQAGAATTNSEGVHIPFKIAVTEGPQYKLAGVQLAPNMGIPQAVFDKQTGLKFGEVASLVQLRRSWAFLLNVYHDNGYMEARILTEPTYNREQATVTYNVTADHGPKYTMGFFRFLNGDDEVKALIQQAWDARKIAQGSTFNEGALRNLALTRNADPALARIFTTWTLSYSLKLHNEAHTVDVDLSLERKH